MKDAMVAGIWGNSNYDSQEKGKEGARRAILESIEEQYQNALAEIYGGKAASVEDEIDWNDPFWAAMKRTPMADPPGVAPTPEKQDEREEVLAMIKEVDQA